MTRSTRIAALSLLALTFMGSAAHAQHGRKHGGNAHKAALKMQKKLSLSSDQTAKIEPILAERRQKMEALRADKSLSPEQFKAQRRQIAQGTRGQMAGVLTPEQASQMKSTRRGHRGVNVPPAGV